MKKYLSKSIVWSCAAASVIFMLAPAASAATTTPAPAASPNTGQALEIAPPLITLTANPGQTIKTQISIRDVSPGALAVTAQVNDFVAAGEDGTPKILMDAEGTNPYSIKDWVTPIGRQILQPKQIKSLPVTITVPANASPGGHYGVIRFTAAPPELNGTGVSLSASLGSLMLININGNAKESLTVASFTASHNGKVGSFFESAPVSFTERIKNDGNTHEQPAGQVSITDMFGKKIGAVNVNLPPRYILPASIRKFEQPLDSSVIGNKRLFGKYTANLNLTYGASKQTVSDTITFWIVPYKLIAAIIVILVGGFFALRAFIKNYNQRIISKAQGSNKKK